MKLNVRALALASLSCVTLAATSSAWSGTLNITVSARGNQRATWQNAFDQFKKANPDVDLKISYVGEEAYKVQMSGWLATDPPEPLADIPEMTRGKGVRLQKYKDGGVLDMKTFAMDSGLSWQDSADRTFTKTRDELMEWIGARAAAGRMVPKGFPRTGKFG